ncbi:hypothetical protein T4E_9887 [Trichinella pseudospiralis]|uniref:Uncharacterized protein n=1 Tax=Trichinella pseudospiralis TaxID=6337 RepID=A0A0V0Y5D8_TRIPS|nr:hypothetical protein T4E_9887 [Trichinella pseudospiralis]
MTTIPTMYNPQQVCGAFTIPSVVLNIQILLCVIDSCSTFVQDMEKCLRVIWTIFQITEVMHQKDHEKSCSADKSDKPYMVFSKPKPAETLHQNINSGMQEHNSELFNLHMNTSSAAIVW